MFSAALRVDLGGGAEVCRPRANPLCVKVCPPSGAVKLAGAGDHKRQVVFLLAAAELLHGGDDGPEQGGNRQVARYPAFTLSQTDSRRERVARLTLRNKHLDGLAR